MFCPKCGKPIPEGYSICMNCGFDTSNVENKQEETNSEINIITNSNNNAEVNSAEQNSKSTPVMKESPKKSKVKLFIPVVLVVIVLIGIACFFMTRKEEPVVGKWNFKKVSMMYNGTNVSLSSTDYSLDVKNDKTFIFHDNGEMKNGTWEIASKELSDIINKASFEVIKVYNMKTENLSFIGTVYKDDAGAIQISFMAYGDKDNYIEYTFTKSK